MPQCKARFGEPIHEATVTKPQRLGVACRAILPHSTGTYLDFPLTGSDSLQRTLSHSFELPPFYNVSGDACHHTYTVARCMESGHTWAMHNQCMGSPVLIQAFQAQTTPAQKGKGPIYKTTSSKAKRAASATCN